MDVVLLISQRLAELGLGQRDLARAAQVTESYVSQLLTRRKAPPAPTRTDIYGKMNRLLKLPSGELARLAEHEHHEQLKKVLGQPAPMFGAVRELILRKCRPEDQKLVRSTFEQHPFGDLERLVTRTLLEVVKQIAAAQLENAPWLREVARFRGGSYEEMRVQLLDFLDTDLLEVSVEHSVAFLEPLLREWTMDLMTFELEIRLNTRLVPDDTRRFGFREIGTGAAETSPGFDAFLADRDMSGTATEEELAFLRKLKPRGRERAALYYYRELQNLRDPLHFMSE